MVKVIKQPKWAFWRYEEIYEFEVPSVSVGLIERILSFYSRRRIRDLVREQTTVRFSRGSALGSLFSPNERHHRHEVIVEWQANGAITQVTCTYHCFDPYPNLHTAPRVLEQEVEALEKRLAAETGEGNLGTKSFRFFRRLGYSGKKDGGLGLGVGFAPQKLLLMTSRIGYQRGGLYDDR